jgi:transcriptional regulator with XRE-family HTH domain
MHSAADILAALRRQLDARAITQREIAAVLGVTQPNVTKLWKPATRTGKPRALGYDEGVKLVAAFDLFGDRTGEGDRTAVSAAALAPLLQAILPLAPPGGELSDSAARALAVALRHGLASLPDPAATDPSAADLAGAARAAIARFREAARP